MTRSPDPATLAQFEAHQRGSHPDSHPWPIALVYAHIDAEGLPCSSGLAQTLSLLGLASHASRQCPLLLMDDSLASRGIPGPSPSARYVRQLAGLVPVVETPDSLRIAVDVWPAASFGSIG